MKRSHQKSIGSHLGHFSRLAGEQGTGVMEEELGRQEAAGVGWAVLG